VHLASALAKRSKVTLLQILQPDDEVPAPAEASLFEAFLTARKNRSYTPVTVLKGVLGPLPVTVVNYQSADAADCLAATLRQEKFDAVQMETSNLFSYLDIIRQAPGNPAVVLDWHNIDSELMSRYASETANLGKKLIARRTASLLLRLERKLMRVCDAHTVVSEVDRAKLLQHNPGASVTVVPNGVNSAAFATSLPDAPGNTLLFVGSMDYHANADAVTSFTQNAWPTISKKFPSLKFVIVGRSPGREVRMLASEKIHVTGTVNDVRPFYANALAVIVPLRVGGGTRLKILEAMAAGVPVISTTIGAEGILARHGQEIFLADSTQQIIDALEFLLRNPVLWRNMAEAARLLASKHYDWASIGDRLHNVYSDLIASRREVGLTSC
jgi:glycosyltransferase involved in cell wall biosynthesis